LKTSVLTIACICFFGLLHAQTKEFKAYTRTLPGTSVSFSMTPVPAGSFIMGSPTTETGRDANEGPQRKINISAFWMGTRELTHDEFQLFFNDDSLSRNSDIDAVTRPTPQYIDFSLGMGKQGGFPVNSMSQHTALMYCRWLYQKTGTFYRLPTEAEWEYACRAGSTTSYPFGNDSTKLDEYSWNEHNSGGRYHKTGEKKPNQWGLYDMLGNVGEWTIDQYSDTYFTNLPDKASDPITDPVSRYPKTVKGGGYNTSRGMMRSAGRYKSDKSWNRRDPQIPKSKWWLTDAAAIGFRLVCPVMQPTPVEADALYKKYLNN